MPASAVIKRYRRCKSERAAENHCATWIYGQHFTRSTPSVFADTPDIELQLITADSFFGSVGGEFDVAYRIGKPSDDTCIGRHLGTFSRFIVCTPAYLAQRDISRPEALQRRSHYPSYLEKHLAVPER